MKFRKNRSASDETDKSVPAHFLRELQIEFLLHELKDPFSVIEAGVRMLLENRDKWGPLSERQEKTLQRILRNTLKTKGLLNHLLEVGRSEEGCFSCTRFRPVEALYEAARDALEVSHRILLEDGREPEDEREWEALLRKCGVSVEISPEVRGIRMLQDGPKFCQIVGNLLKNALHHRRERVRIRMEVQGEMLCVEVEDDGPGIKPEHRELVFRRYCQIDARRASARKGHGLGLAGARILARRLGGDIRLESRKKGGAVFRLFLPLEAPLPEAPREPGLE